MLDFIIIVMVVWNTVPKISCGDSCFICILYPDSMCGIHYVFCLCINEMSKEGMLFVQNHIFSWNNFFVHFSSWRGLSGLPLGLSNPFPVICGCSSNFLFLMNELLTTWKTLRGPASHHTWDPKWGPCPLEYRKNDFVLIFLEPFLCLHIFYNGIIVQWYMYIILNK